MSIYLQFVEQVGDCKRGLEPNHSVPPVKSTIWAPQEVSGCAGKESF